MLNYVEPEFQILSVKSRQSMDLRMIYIFLLLLQTYPITHDINDAVKFRYNTV